MKLSKRIPRKVSWQHMFFRWILNAKMAGLEEPKTSIAKHAISRSHEIYWKLIPKGIQILIHRSRLLRLPLFGHNLLMHFYRSLPDFWRPFGALLVPIGLFCKIFNDSSPPDSARFCEYLAKSGCPQTASIQRCRRSSRCYNGIQNRLSGAKNLNKHRCTPHWGVMEPIFFPNRFGLTYWWFVVDSWSIWARHFANLSN